jgi:hypothetical protein
MVYTTRSTPGFRGYMRAYIGATWLFKGYMIVRLDMHLIPFAKNVAKKVFKAYMVYTARSTPGFRATCKPTSSLHRAYIQAYIGLVKAMKKAT